MSGRGYIAIDLGAESGRVIVGTLAGDGPERLTLKLHEAHRFGHEPMSIAGEPSGLSWNIEHIWREIRRGLRAAAEGAKLRVGPAGEGASIISIGVDTWGVDFVLLDDAGRPLAPARCYRDPRHAAGMAMLGERMGFERLYQRTGVREAPINSSAQLAGAKLAGDSAPARAEKLLFMPGYFHFLLSGVGRNETSIASTSQLLDAHSAAPGRWSGPVLEAAGISERALGEVVAPGTVLGAMRREVADEVGLPEETLVVSPASHDTASAVAAVPAVNIRNGGEDWAFISSGTWSLMGAECAAPVLTPDAHAMGFTNERGPRGTFRFQKNLVGLWLVQEVRRDLERLGRGAGGGGEGGAHLSYDQLTHAAEKAEPFRTGLASSHGPLGSPGDMVAKIRAYARSVGDPEPITPGELVRCCLESLAIEYRRCLEQLESRLGRRFETLHVVGGGCRNALLCQMTADATGRRVLAGPVEATAAGNVLVQAAADPGSGVAWDSIRRITARSFQPVEYAPRNTAEWSSEYARRRGREAHR